MGRRHRFRRVDPGPAERGFDVVGAANPLAHLTGDTASLAALLRTISDPIVLVGHSYGGAVMSNRRQRERAGAGACLHRWVDARRG
jgi:pimeloyl-ACP methyl ester carboxylesterase